LLITEGVVSYSLPQGDVLDDIDLIDDMYDGISDNGFLKGTLPLYSYHLHIVAECPNLNF
jgi:hypothetical protein